MVHQYLTEDYALCKLVTEFPNRIENVQTEKPFHYAARIIMPKCICSNGRLSTYSVYKDWCDWLKACRVANNRHFDYIYLVKMEGNIPSAIIIV